LLFLGEGAVGAEGAQSPQLDVVTQPAQVP
jgi:hypothetical protein